MASSTGYDSDDTHSRHRSASTPAAFKTMLERAVHEGHLQWMREHAGEVVTFDLQTQHLLHYPWCVHDPLTTTNGSVF